MRRQDPPPRSIALKNLLAGLVFVVLIFVAIASSKSEAAESRPVPLVICDVFGERFCSEALRVSWCESRWHTDARNGQYRGIFQMGSWERERFGHGPDAYSQARAAWRYFVRTGRDWSPWECAP